jgi:hypothetical protein
MFPSLSQSLTPYHAEPDQELLLELSARLFGAEVGWFTFHHNARDAAKELFDNTFDLVDKVVKKAKDFDVSAGVVLFHPQFLLTL